CGRRCGPPLARDGVRHLSFFFFSSRRRHTRFSRDWSSDVCSSDLFGLPLEVEESLAIFLPYGAAFADGGEEGGGGDEVEIGRKRSEERRVGKECRARRWPRQESRK